MFGFKRFFFLVVFFCYGAAMNRRLHAWRVHFFMFACNCIECWHLAKLLRKFSCPLMRYYTVIREMFIFDFWCYVVAWPEGRLVKCIYYTYRYSIHNIFDRLFGKHLSVLNFIRQANNCMSDYWIQQLIHPTYPLTYLNIPKHPSIHMDAYIHIAISLELHFTFRINVKTELFGK